MGEIRLWHNARVYGEVEPLLEWFEERGLVQKGARQFVADLARKAPRKRGAPRTRAAESRDIRIGYIVANRMGLLVRDGKDPRRAFAGVARELELQGAGLSPKQIRRIYEAAVNEWGTWLFNGQYYLGRDEGFKSTLYLDM